MDVLVGGPATVPVSESASLTSVYALPLLSEGAGLEESLRTKDEFLTLRFPRTVVESVGFVSISP